MKVKIVEYIKQLEKAYEHNEKLRYHPINVNTSMNNYYQGRADSIRSIINDLNDILKGIAVVNYKERLDLWKEL